jgi:peroxiredoxin
MVAFGALLIYEEKKGFQMAVTPSTMVPLGTPAPNFALPSIQGQTVLLSDYDQSEILVIVFMCNHCPFVKHLAKGLVQFDADYRLLSVATVGINSNDVEKYADDGFEQMEKEASGQGYEFHYLLDETQEVAKAYKAACTPDFFVFDKERKLVYRGQFDDSRPGNGLPVTGKDLRLAIEVTLKGQAVSFQQKPAIGCNIKWKSGNEPLYFQSK